MSTMHRRTLLAAALIAGTLPLPATAATVTDTFDVTITIQDACEITTPATDMAFGTAGPLTSVVTATSSIYVTCTESLAYNIGLDAGANPGTGGDTTTRQMVNGANNVSYDLLQSAGGAHWGDTIGTDTQAGTGTGAEETYTVYGTVPIQATPPALTYSDTVTVTVTY
ncbi:MAG: spore coat U domain-containing protein [Gammaproteobacteria bacterium]|nr:spore coat U domain-containing protein [Gammaproteobacteria bacterium]